MYFLIVTSSGHCSGELEPINIISRSLSSRTFGIYRTE